MPGRGRSYLTNATDTSLARPLAPIDTTVEVNDASILPKVPFYVVVEPFGDHEREYLWITAAVGNVLTIGERSLPGSQRRIHDPGSRVRVTYTAQHLDDLWEGIAEVHNLGQGPQGVAGPIGPIGPPSAVPGPPGPRGDQLYVGVGDPTVMSTPGAQPGDDYLDTATGELWKLT